jgi:predicted GTPase
MSAKKGNTACLSLSLSILFTHSITGTLTNELIGQKLSITSHRPQTTRHRIHAIDTTDDYQMVFVDTPGMHIGNAKAINAYMNRVASSSINDVDIILWLVEAGKWTKEDARVLAHVAKGATYHCNKTCFMTHEAFFSFNFSSKTSAHICSALLMLLASC